MTQKPDTLLTTLGRDPERNHGVVNPPVYHASTILFPTLAALEAAEAGTHPLPTYGRRGTPTTFALEDAISVLEGGDETLVLPSGMAAIAVSLLAFVEAGDHVLISDNAYGSVRAFVRHLFGRLRVETTWFDPAIGSGIDALIRPNTRIVLCEAPGSQTFEMQDVPAVAAAARRRGVIVAMDNTWATPLFFRPLDHGVDLSIQAATKYVVGHSDAMLGLVTVRREHHDRMRKTANELGYAAAPDDCFLALRGLRTLSVRLARHQETAMRLADFLAGRPEVARVLHPAMPSDPGHALWRRDFSGASGLFGIVLKPAPHAALAAMVDHLELFGMGWSWGGYESLILPCDPRGIRTAVPWTEPGQLLRLHAGLEDADDLIADLAAGLDRLNRHR